MRNKLEPMLPTPYRVVARQVETHDSVTLGLKPVAEQLPQFQPGQFTMLYAHGIGEIPVSISGQPYTGDGWLTQTIRAVGAVSRALHDARLGAIVGVRGPFGTTWSLESAQGHDLLIAAGGIGLAPLRPVVLGALAHRQWYGRIMVVAGARGPEEFLFRAELAAWAARDDLDVTLTVDQPAQNWTGRVGFVTEPLAGLHLDPCRTIAFLCGPEPMMRICAHVLLRHGLPAEQIRLSLERNMQCGIGLCGHCQLGPLLVCRDGPIVDYATAADLLTVREL